MAKFRYKAKNIDNKIMKGVLFAKDEEELRQILSNQKYFGLRSQNFGKQAVLHLPGKGQPRRARDFLPRVCDHDFRGNHDYESDRNFENEHQEQETQGNPGGSPHRAFEGQDAFGFFGKVSENLPRLFPEHDQDRGNQRALG